MNQTNNHTPTNNKTTNYILVSNLTKEKSSLDLSFFKQNKALQKDKTHKYNTELLHINTPCETKERVIASEENTLRLDDKVLDHPPQTNQYIHPQNFPLSQLSLSLSLIETG